MRFETKDEFIRFVYTTPLHQRGQVFVEEIYSPIDTETPESLEENLYKHKARGDRFVVVPDDSKYYDVSSSSTEILEDELVIDQYTDLIIALQKLAWNPFLLVDTEKNSKFEIYDKCDFEDETEEGVIESLSQEPDEVLDYDELKDRYPEVANEYKNEKGGEQERYGIITLSEVNQRQVKEALYPSIAEFERAIASIIEEEYPASRELLEIVGRDAERTWKESQETEAAAHISEFMNLTDMRKLVSDSMALAQKCGFKVDEDIGSEGEEVQDISDFRAYDVEFVFKELSSLRNKVMHANRALVHDREDLNKLVFQLQLLMAFIDDVSEDFSIGEDETEA